MELIIAGLEWMQRKVEWKTLKFTRRVILGLSQTSERVICEAIYRRLPKLSIQGPSSREQSVARARTI